MPARSPARRVAGWLAILALAAAPAAAQDGATLFNGGDGLQARLGRADGPVLPQGQFSCAGCHGADGRGGTEGGSQPPPPIDWASLATATPQRPAYDEAAFARLLTQGVTPSGRVISTRMPRFQGPPQAIAALSAHLRTLDAAERLGLTADGVAVALPQSSGNRAAALAAIAAFNAEGGAFGRRVVVADPAFLDLGRAIDILLPRLRQAEDARLQELLSQNQGLAPFTENGLAARIAGTADQLGPHLRRILPKVSEVQMVGPSAEAMAWALETHRDARAAHAYAATRATLILLRDQGRQPTRTRTVKGLGSLDLSPFIEVYRQQGHGPAR